jgi:uncharacterized membrane protein YbhN (UPF0104 family)
VAVAAGFLALPALTAHPERLIEGCGKWILIAGVSELLSVLGFVLVFKLVFGGHMSWHRSAPASLRALGTSALLPGGGLIGPGAGAWSAGPEKPSISRLARSTITLVILTEAPGVIVLGALGMLLWLGLASGPHAAVLTLLPAALAPGLVVATWLARRSSRRPRRRRGPGHGRVLSHRLARPAAALREGVTEAHRLLLGRDWKLIGALAYYGFDNAVLWAAFHAYGRTPPLSIVVMGYLLGSLGSALPLPGGLGVAGGMIGALVLYGAPAAGAAAAVLLYRGISLAVPLALGAAAWTYSPAATWVLRVNAGRTRRRSSARETPAGGRTVAAHSSTPRELIRGHAERSRALPVRTRPDRRSRPGDALL